MSPRLRPLLLALALTVPAAALAEQAPPGSATAQERIVITVRQGDTCSSIAQRLYGDERFYFIISDHLSGVESVLRQRCDDRLRPGLTLRLPRRIPDSRRPPDAEVTAVVRRVRSRSPSAEQWDPAQPGQELFRGWRVNTLERSEAELTFRDLSAVHLREETLVIIFGPTADTARRRTSKATLERGTLRSRLGELSGRSELDLRTPSARALLRRGEAVVSVDEEETSRVANHSGLPARVAAKRGGGEVLVRAGMGTTVRRGQRPAEPRPLLDPPRWGRDQSSLFIGIGELAPATVRGAWLPVRGAEGYRVELALDDDGRRPVGSTAVKGAVTRFELRGFPAGTIYVAVAAIDDDGLEGPLSSWRALQIEHLEVVPPEIVAAEDHPETPPGTRPRLLAGSRLMTPGSLRCGLGDRPPDEADLTLSGRGVSSINCVDQAGRGAPRLLVEVVPLSLRPLDNANRDERADRLRRGTSAVIYLDGVDGSQLGPGALVARAGPGLRVEELSVDDDGRASVSLWCALDAPPESFVELRLRRPGARRVVLGRVDFGVDAPPPPPDQRAPSPNQAPPPRTEEHRPLSEAAALMASPSLFGLRDEQRRGSGAWIATEYSHASSAPQDRGLVSLGLRAAWLDERLRLDVAAPIGLQEQLDYGARVAVSSLIAAGERFGAAAELGLWLPFDQDDHAGRYALRFVPTVDLSLRLGERVALRSRQGLIADATGVGLLAWASAYGVDLWLVGPLGLGAAASLTLGRQDQQTVVLSTASLSASLAFDLVTLTLAGRVGLTDATARRSGRFAVTLTARFAITQ